MSRARIQSCQLFFVFKKGLLDVNVILVGSTMHLAHEDAIVEDILYHKHVLERIVLLVTHVLPAVL
jgi:hypothetical protein